jgi:hypothetical protein
MGDLRVGGIFALACQRRRQCARTSDNLTQVTA